MNRLCASLLTLVGTWMVFSSEADARPVGNAFTYQGSLKQAGVPATGVFDLDFRLFNVSAGGTALATIPALDHAISEGLVKVDLNFGPGQFDGNQRWLEIVVDGVALAPRQEIRAAPYAMFAQTTGTVPNAALAGTYSSPVTLSNASGSFSGTFAGSGAGLNNLSATNISNGNLSIVNMPTHGDWSPTGDISIDAGTLYIDPVNNEVGIGTTTPAGALDVVGSFRARPSESTNGFSIIHAPGDYRLVAFDAKALTLNTGTSSVASVRLFVAPDGDIGIGTGISDPSARLEVVTGSAATVPLKVRGNSAQTANLQEWISNGGLVASMDASGAFNGLKVEGNLAVGTASALAPVHIAEGAAGIAPHSNASMALERNGNNYICMLAPDANEAFSSAIHPAWRPQAECSSTPPATRAAFSFEPIPTTRR